LCKKKAVEIPKAPGFLGQAPAIPPSVFQLAKKSKRSPMGLVMVGHKGAGKSTAAGNLMFQMKALDRDFVKMLNDMAISDVLAYSYAFDKTTEERQRETSIHSTKEHLSTEKYDYVIIDVPGNLNYIKTLVLGAAQADVGLLIVSAKEREFEETFKPQSRLHCRLLHLLGVDQLIVGVTKMDDVSVEYKEERFEEIRGVLLESLANIGFKTDKVAILPISGWKGDNIKDPSDKMPWWKGFQTKDGESVKTLSQALDNAVRPPRRKKRAPLRFPISQVLKIEGVGNIIAGRVEQGSMKVKDQVRFAISGAKGQIISIQRNHRNQKEGRAGQSLGLNVRLTGSRTKPPKVGDILYLTKERGCFAIGEFTAHVFVQTHPGQLKAAQNGKNGFTPVCHVRTGRSACQLFKILWKKGKDGNKIENPDFIEAGDEAEAIFKPEGQICVEPYDKCKPLGRLAFMNSNKLVMVGRVKSVQKASPMSNMKGPVEVNDRKHMSIVLVGHSQSGKSTLGGNLLRSTGQLSKNALKRLKKAASKMSQDDKYYAFAFDTTLQEREKGLTIHTKSKLITTDKYNYTIVDVPGHTDYIKNMISGGSTADVAVLVVPAPDEDFAISVRKKDHDAGIPQGQTRQHARLLQLLGIDQVIIAVNKMDHPSIYYSEDVFNFVKQEMTIMLEKMGYSAKRIAFVPMSAKEGDNVAEATTNMPWYKGWNIQTKNGEARGRTLLDALNMAVRVPKRYQYRPLRLPVGQVMTLEGIGHVITGKIEQGTVKAGDTVEFANCDCEGTVTSIQMHHQTIPEAFPGYQIGLNIEFDGDIPSVGDVMSLVGQEVAATALQFTATVFVQDHPGQLRAAQEGQGGFTPICVVRTARVPCKMLKIIWKEDGGGNREESPQYLEAGDQAEVVFLPQNPICVEAYEYCKPLGRIAFMDGTNLVMVGRVLNVQKGHKVIEAPPVNCQPATDNPSPLTGFKILGGVGMNTLGAS